MKRDTKYLFSIFLSGRGLNNEKNFYIDGIYYDGAIS